MSKLKVYGGSVIIGRKQARAIIATTSKKEVAKIVGVTLYKIRTYWAATENKSEIDVATSNPGVMYIHHQGKYIRPKTESQKYWEEWQVSRMRVQWGCLNCCNENRKGKWTEIKCKYLVRVWLKKCKLECSNFKGEKNE